MGNQGLNKFYCFLKTNIGIQGINKCIDLTIPLVHLELLALYVSHLKVELPWKKDNQLFHHRQSATLREFFSEKKINWKLK